MPLTPFHLGPAFLFGLAFTAVFDLPTLLIASVIPDVEPFIVLYAPIYGYPLHGFFHSYLGSSIFALSVVAACHLLKDFLAKIMAIFRVPQKSSFKKILFASFVGVYSHVFLDSFLYPEMMPFYPLQGNPFLNLLSVYGSYRIVYGFCSIAFILGVIAYFYKISRRAKT